MTNLLKRLASCEDGATMVEYALMVALVAAVSAYISRLFLMTTAYQIESDLRNNMYEHLVHMSFPFYDRVQTGQLISRANSDIRSVQMYLTFGPSILVQCAMAVVAFVYMLRINVPLAFVAMATMPFIYVLSVRMRKSMFPVSWLIQARERTVPTTWKSVFRLGPASTTQKRTVSPGIAVSGCVLYCAA